MPTIGDMKGKVALVTGSASGLGRATALKLAGAGANLYLVDVNGAGLAETAELLKAFASTIKITVRTADLAARETCFEVVADAVKTFGRLDALCNIAGIMWIGHTPDMPADIFEKIMAVNLHAPFHLIQAAMPHLLKVHGAVVNVTSQAAFIGQAYMSAYCATKAGLTHMTKALAMEYSHKQVRINAVSPGGMPTAIGKAMTPPPDVDVALIRRFVALRGMVEVDDVAEMVAFLATDAARSYHGACVCIDNGVTIG